MSLAGIWDGYGSYFFKEKEELSVYMPEYQLPAFT